MRNINILKNRRFKLKSWFVASLITVTFSLSTATAQEAIVTAGINVSGNDGSLSYSVGQVVYLFHTGTNGSVVEGVQQPYRILGASVLKKESRNISLTFSAFPNPATDLLFLNVENFDNENLSFQVVDIHGRVLHTQKITDSQTRIVISNLAPAIYGVQIMSDNKLVNTIKIVKN